jgi:hypothetical protein
VAASVGAGGRSERVGEIGAEGGTIELQELVRVLGSVIEGFLSREFVDPFS